MNIHFLKAYSRSIFVVFIFVSLCSFAQSDPLLPGSVRDRIDQAAHDVLDRTGVPSASIAIVKDGQIAYLQAYGDARLQPKIAAALGMRYAIGSISKQFTATAILMLAEEGKLSLDDAVGKFLPDLTRANEVTIRQLLSHTSGYQDYWPQDYAPPFMLYDVTARDILERWARKPLDFDPGTKWQYSNTNFVIAGLIAEKASGVPLLRFLSDRIFTPLGMKSVMNIDQNRLTETDATGYFRYALGPLRPAPKEGKGWLFAAGELAMPAQDLARWNIGMIEQRLLKSQSYREMQTEVRLKNGQGTNYGLGVDVENVLGHRAIAHSGEVSGFTAQNVVFPDDKAAITVLTNEDAASAAGEIARRIEPLLLSGTGQGADPKLEQTEKIFQGLQHGRIDRSLLTENAQFYFNDQALKDFGDSLGPLGTPEEFVKTREEGRGGMTLRTYRVKFPQRTLGIIIYEMPDGKLEQFQVFARE
jgi:D-alanyl-D-alanine carboxypeptidase